MEDDIVRVIEGLRDADLLRLISLISMELKDRIRIYRLIERRLESMEVGRLTDKLALAAAVAPRQAAKIEARADKIIAQEPDIEKQTDDAFSGHESILEEAQKGLDDLRKELATMTNNPPLPASDASPEAPATMDTPSRPCPRCQAGSVPIKRPDTGEWVHNISVAGNPGIGQTICLNPPHE